MAESYLHFNGFEKVLIGENYNIPTVVYQNNKSILVGYDVYEKIEDYEKVNKNFKVDLGRIDPSKFSTDYRTYKTADGNMVSALKLSEIFLNKVIEGTNSYLENNGLPQSKNVMIAEPLVLQTNDPDHNIDESWLANYRKNLRKYFENKGFANISFLPEPFAVFQYYKYCKKFAPLNNHDQLVIMVVDFGGGTFDTCIIETTMEGDIKKGGKNSKPLGASSIARGGSDLDKEILNDLLLKYNANDDARIKRNYRAYKEVQRNHSLLNNYTQEQKNFYYNYERALHLIEEFKIKLVNNIQNWNLNESISNSISISLPRDFFSNDDKITEYRITALQLRDIFIRFYDQNLKKGIKLTMERGREETNNQNPDYILLSGGSSKIGWLNELIKRDFQMEISTAEFVKLENYKEVVSIGLAVECARRFYNESGDFSDTTYNTINLILNPNNKGIEIPAFKSKNFDSILKNDGVILPTSTIIRQYFDKKITWRFRLKNEPKNELEYYFLRNSLDYQKTDDLLNLIDHSARVNSKTFEKHLLLNLIIKEDGTVIPSFTVNSKNEQNSLINCKPFYLDMTYGDAPKKSQTYLGIDFGTCNSSISYVDNNQIEKYNSQSKEIEINLLKEILEKAPYPMSFHLARFQKVYEEEKKAKRFMHFFEDSLAILLYSTICELNCKRPDIKIDLSKYMRAAGSIKGNLKSLIPKINGNFLFTKELLGYNKQEFLDVIEGSSKFVNEYKHKKYVSPNYNYDNSIKVINECIYKIFANVKFGFFDRIETMPFSSTTSAEFILAHGNGYFSEKMIFNGDISLAKEFCFLVNVEEKKAMNLFPFVFREYCKSHVDADHGHIFIFDLYDEKEKAYVFSAVDQNCEKRIRPSDSQYSIFDQYFSDFKNGRPRIQYHDIELKSF